ncbi:hypothetical protein C7293_06255 [filamentous cyanobacterium CCT1]|nr:hypothetical protein C7293_06255 [filamentous cyanobacterium CCT1]
MNRKQIMKNKLIYLGLHGLLVALCFAVGDILGWPWWPNAIGWLFLAFLGNKGLWNVARSFN